MTEIHYPNLLLILPLLMILKHCWTDTTVIAYLIFILIRITKYIINYFLWMYRHKPLSLKYKIQIFSIYVCTVCKLNLAFNTLINHHTIANSIYLYVFNLSAQLLELLKLNSTPHVGSGYFLSVHARGSGG